MKVETLRWFNNRLEMIDQRILPAAFEYLSYYTAASVAEGALRFGRVQAAPADNDDKVMRLRAQTAKIEGHFVLFPEKAPWLDAYLLELTTFPNAKHDDQVDSTVHALAWLTQQANAPGMALYTLTKMKYEQRKRMTRVQVPPGSSHWGLITGRQVVIPPDRIIEVTNEELEAVLRNGGRRVD